ncbi:MAG: hypothetical protein ACJ706_08135 [Nitrososphaeraceae archaeon]
MDYYNHSSSSNNDDDDDDKENTAKKIVLDEINNVHFDPAIIKQNECAACHILFKLVDKMQVSESEASDVLTEILSHDQELNDLFIEMVETIHMKQRMMAIPFSIKSRDAKDRYIDSNFKNLLAELSSDLINYGSDVVLRKLLISSMALEIAQNLGIDYHAATEELYYYMRKNERQTHESIIAFIDGFYKKIKKDYRNI